MMNPRFNGKACIANPLFGTTSLHAAALFQVLGKDFAEAFFNSLNTNGVKMLSSNKVRRRVTAGDFAFGIADTEHFSMASKDGEPVGVVFPDQQAFGALVIPAAVVLIPQGPNPEQGKRFIDFLLRSDIQKLLGANQGIPSLDKIKPMEVDYGKAGVSIRGALPRILKGMGRQTTMISCAVLAGACLFALANMVEAGPPFVTDDPAPPPPGGWEINIPFIVEHTSGQTEMDAPLFDLNYGLPNLQLKLEVPVRIVQQEGNRAVGLGDPLLGVKWRFLADQKSQVELGVYPQVLLPLGDHRRGLGEGRAAYVLPLLLQKDWAEWTLYGNVGYWWQTTGDQRNFWYAGAVLERELNERLTLGVELFGSTPQEKGGRVEVAFNIGEVLKLNEHVNLLCSVGRDIVGDARVMAYVGLQFLTK
jgi:outer membrane putative beta-barrel porin/alpha-amylase/extracellular solute-binding protein